MHWLPKARAPSEMISGRASAAEFRLILSAPARNSVRMSSVVRTPPPTVSGMKHRSAVRSITSRIDLRPSDDAVMSKKTSSSAPCSLYRSASSTGSPTLRSPFSSARPNCRPRVTRPAWTSRQGMTRLASMGKSA
jgi:hypothetical protein